MRNHSTTSSVDEASRRIFADQPATLCFHKVTDRFTYGSTNYSPKRLSRLLAHLQNQGFTFCSVPAREGPDIPKRVLITFDDGYAHLADALPPLVECFGVEPVVFVPTALIGKPNRWDYSHSVRNERHLTASEIKGLAIGGVRFGSHGHRHVDLTSLTDSALKNEMVACKAVLEDLLGTEISSLSYPFGRVNERVADAAGAAGFSDGYTMRFPESDDPSLQRGRYAVYFYDTPASVGRKLGGGFGRRLEKVRAGLTNRLSFGTILLNRLRRTDDL